MLGLNKNEFGAALAQAKKKSNIDDTSNERYADLIEKGKFEISLLTKTKRPNKNSFAKAASCFEQAINIKSMRPEAYFYLSWLFVFINDTEKAKIYYNICYSIDQNFKGLSNLSKLI